MTYGYSQRLVHANKSASTKSLGVALGRVCIRANISVSKIADDFGVTRMTIYNWFKGESTPHSGYAQTINDYITNTKAQHQIN